MSPLLPLDRGFAPLWRLLCVLVDATAVWAGRGDHDEALVGRVRREAIERNFERAVELIPLYRRLVGAQRREHRHGLDEIVERFLVTTDVFKSYDPRWLEVADYARMTDWLGGLFFRRPEVLLDGVDDVDGWKQRLRADRVHLSWSSGTSGRLSFVPRDPVAHHAVRTNGASSFHRRLAGSPEGTAAMACLVLGPRGSGLGIQAAATGLARAASRSHHLFDAGTGAGGPRPGSRPPAGPGGGAEASYAAAADFLRHASADGVPVLVFGPPFELQRTCERVGRSPLPAGSLVVTGGGWKGGSGLSRDGLADAVWRTFAVPPAGVIDVYATTECNAVLLSCAEGAYHVPPLVEPVVLDDVLEPVDGDDAVGILGLLDPFAVSYPGLLVTGDLAHLTRRPCPCGLSGWSIIGPIERAATEEAKGCAGVLASSMA